MATRNFSRKLSSVAVAAALGVSSLPAYAAVYAGVFDPIDFSGTFIINVDDDCLNSNGWKENAGIAFNASDGICTATLTSASALVTSSPPDGPFYEGTLTFAPPPVSDPSQLFGIFIDNYTLDSLDTALLPFQSADPPTPDSWWLQFTTGQMEGGNPQPPTPECDPYCFDNFDALAVLSPSLTSDPNPARGVYLFAGNANTNDEPVLVDTAQYISIRLVNQVPEPGTLGLLLGALGAGWLVKRRRTKPESAP